MPNCLYSVANALLVTGTEEVYLALSVVRYGRVRGGAAIRHVLAVLHAFLPI